MFQVHTTVGFGGTDVAFDGELAERLTTPQPVVSKLTAVALQRELPRLFARVPSSAPLEQISLIRCIDLVVACACILFFAPLMLFIAISILATGAGPIFFRQQRLGLGGRSFTCLKFRTMRLGAETALMDVLSKDPSAKAEWERAQKLREDPRVSKLGSYLRRTSLDELPQFFNVIAGDMSVVGPRPIVVEEAHRYRRYFREYCAVKPGLTGLWQISGRTQTTYRRRVACDVRYARNRSVVLDLAIIAATVPVVLFGRGAY